MSYKKQNTVSAFVRLWALLWLFTIGGLLAFAYIVFVVVYGAFDLLLNLLGQDGLSFGAESVTATADWFAGQLEFILFGNGAWVPTPWQL